MEDHTTKYYAGQGAVYVSQLLNNQPVGYKFLGDVESLTLTPDVQRNEILENVSGSRGVGASFLTRVAYSLSITSRSIKAEHLALALQNDATHLAAGSVTDEPAIAQQGAMIRLARQNVSNVVITPDPPGVAFTEGSDYVVHSDAGLVEILATGTINNDAALLIDYDFTAQNVVSAYPQNAPVAVLFAGKNVAENETIRCEVYKCKLDPASFDLINADGSSSQRSGVVEQDTSRAANDQLFSWIVNS